MVESASGGSWGVSKIFESLLPGNDIDRIKEQIAHVLSKLPGRIIVVIDDLDRLEYEEMLLILKIVR
jgi:hypothetical protein